MTLKNITLALTLAFGLSLSGAALACEDECKCAHGDQAAHAEAHGKEHAKKDKKAHKKCENCALKHKKSDSKQETGSES